MNRLFALLIVLALAGSAVAQTATPTPAPTATPTPTPTNTPMYRGEVYDAAVRGEVKISRVDTTGTLTLKVGGVSGSSANEYGFEVFEVRVHLDGAGTTQTLSVAVENSTSARHNTVLASQSMVSVTDFVWRPTPSAIFGKDDVLAVTWGNAGAKAAGASVVWRRR